MGVGEDCVGYASSDNRLFPFMQADFLHMRHGEIFFPSGQRPYIFLSLKKKKITATLISRPQKQSRRDVFFRRKKKKSGRDKDECPCLIL